MKSLPAGVQTALEARAITMRDFIRIIGRDRTTGDPVEYGVWSDLGAVSAQVVDPATGIDVTRSFDGAGGLVSVAPVPMTSTTAVSEITVTFSQLADVNELLRAYDIRQARIEIYRGIFTPALVQIAPAFPRFVGFVDELEVKTPEENSDGSVPMTCVSQWQEMSRTNPATRSDANMRKRSPGDTFARHAASVGEWELLWGV